MKTEACNLFCCGYVTEAQQDDIFKLSPVQKKRNRRHTPRSPLPSPAGDLSLMIHKLYKTVFSLLTSLFPCPRFLELTRRCISQSGYEFNNW